MATWFEIQRRIVVRKDAAGVVVSRRELPNWYGRMKVDGKWKWMKLFTDKRASQQRWAEVVRQTEQRRAGVITPQMDAAKQPLAGHVAEYLAALKRIVTDEHWRIVNFMLPNFIKLAGWKSLAEVNDKGASRALSALQAKGHTVAYCNQYLTRVKAFLNWCVPDRLSANPLAKMKRGNAKKALKRRARRPLAERELTALLNSCPASRRLKYAFPAFTGLRRKELAEVCWGDVHLDSLIPYVQLRAEQTKTGEAIALPLHPFIVDELKSLMPGMPETKLFSFLPEGRTMLKDLTKAEVVQADAAGRRADYHGLRHTFAKRLDESGCSHATRRALMRHGAGDQTDGYTLARLSEMYDAIKRLPAPDRAETVTQIKTGTNDSVDTGWTQRVLEPAAIGSNPAGDDGRASAVFTRENTAFQHDRQGMASIGLLDAANRNTVEKTGPRSSVG
jgi:integrase